ncbi:MAG: glycosyltransferase family 2 protein [Clostridia bacterium]|nr:glycosyltransferase family 2 protein [Clostridia bacterium]
MPVLSVIIPIYNVENYLAECVDSVLNQSFTDLEVILVDDGSPDNCPLICDDYAKKDNRVKVVHKQNGGLSSARNAGLNIASGEYVIFLDSDDYYRNLDFLEKIVESLNGCDALFFQRVKLFNDKDFGDNPSNYNENINELSIEKQFVELAKSNKIDASAAMKVTCRTFLIQNNLFFKEGLVCEDIEWFFRYAQKLNNVRFSNYTSYVYRIRSNSISHSIKLKNVQDLFYSIENYADEIKNSNLSIKEPLLNYLAYQYFIVLGLSGAYLNGVDKKLILDKCKEYKWLSNYTCGKKNKLSAFVVKLFGVKIASYILGFYIGIKK